jgi:hypothetical protein
LGGTIASQIGLAFQQGSEVVNVRPLLLGRELSELRILPSDKGEFQRGKIVLHITQ